MGRPRFALPGEERATVRRTERCRVIGAYELAYFTTCKEKRRTSFFLDLQRVHAPVPNAGRMRKIEKRKSAPPLFRAGRALFSVLKRNASRGGRVLAEVGFGPLRRGFFLGTTEIQEDHERQQHEAREKDHELDPEPHRKRPAQNRADDAPYLLRRVGETENAAAVFGVRAVREHRVDGGENAREGKPPR